MLESYVVDEADSTVEVGSSVKVAVGSTVGTRVGTSVGIDVGGIGVSVGTGASVEIAIIAVESSVPCTMVGGCAPKLIIPSTITKVSTNTMLMKLGEVC